MGTGLDLDLGDHGVLHDLGHDTDKAIARGLGSRLVRLLVTGDFDRQRGQFGAVKVATVVGPGRGLDPSSHGPAPQRVHAHAEEFCGLANAVFRHSTRIVSRPSERCAASIDDLSSYPPIMDIERAGRKNSGSLMAWPGNFAHTARRKSRAISASLPPPRTTSRTVCSSSENRQLRIAPSAVNRRRLQVPQNGWV